MRTHLIPLKPHSVPYLVACWLNKQESRPAGTIAKLALLSKVQYLKIIPILYSTLVLGGDHQHHCLRLPHAANILDTADTFHMAREAVQDRTFWRVGDIWYNMTRRLYLLSLVKTIYLVGPLPTLLSCDIVAEIDVNLFPRAQCIVFGPGVVDAIGAMPFKVLGQKLDPPYSCVSTDGMVKFLNEIRPVWLNALVANTRPRRLHIQYRQDDYRNFVMTEHHNGDGNCNCCSFSFRMKFLGPPHQWASLETIFVHGLVDQRLPVVLNCKNIYIFSSHLIRSEDLESRTNDGPSTSTPQRKSLVELNRSPGYIVGLAGVSWDWRLGSLAEIMDTCRPFLGHPFTKKMYNGVLPRQFALRFYNVAGHVGFPLDTGNIEPVAGQVRQMFFEKAEKARQHESSLNPEQKDVIPHHTRIDIKVTTTKYKNICCRGQDHSSRLS
jgi:hypothetical protein